MKKLRKAATRHNLGLGITGQRWEATRVPMRGPRPKRGVVSGAPFGSAVPSQRTRFGLGTSAINPGGWGLAPIQ
jgi:hypothetical protein